MLSRGLVRTCKWLVASVFVLACDLGARGATISVNFVGGQGAANSPGASPVTGTAGVVPAAGWNNEVNAAQTTAVAVNDSGGTGAASLTYTAPNNWAATGTTPAGGSDAALMNGYLDNFQNAGNITITGLGSAFTSGGYDVIVYQNTDSAGSWGYTVTDNAGHSGTRYGQQLAGGGANYPLAGGINGYVEGTSTTSAGSGTASNYVRLTGLTGANFTIAGAAGTTGDGRVRPNGFQVVSVPEPTGLALLGLGSLGLLARRRRQV